ncbi:MAG: glycoside hydrolase family 3 C-terminal domain-containing protein [PS1 clade bacterium]|uniref:Beta-D-glucoside glucohydrolase n=1 Tax=PS1 clade bacterium TaxID=2175152 RepID=A0A937HKM2_9PROT|nr:glycoside hydrolase family 3 C-terminal domain-containing protein [PS1 clade bacterium]
MKHPYDFESAATTLVARMSVDEKTSLMSGSTFWHLQPLAQYELPQIMVSDGPHGLRKQGNQADHMGLTASVPATCFPTAVTLASSWNRELIHQVGAAIGAECQAEGVSVLLAPGVNIKRSPLCGRNFEYYSEDPYMAGEMATAFVQGVQSTGTGTSLKHFAVNNQEAQRMVVDTLVDRRTLFEIYLPAFEAAVTQAQPWTVMCAYNRFNGIYCSEHEELLSGILRDRWGFKGLVVTDWGAVNDRPRGIAAGLELEMPSSGGVNDRLVAAQVKDGAFDEAHLDRAASRVTQLIMASKNNAAPAEVDFDAHHALARRAAAEGAVLLKNTGLLPLKAVASVALIGAFADTPRFQGAGSSQVNAAKLDRPLDAFAERLGADNVTYAKGFDAELAEADAALIDEAVAAAKAANVAIIMAGLPPLFEAEGFDRTHLRQPEQIEKLISAVADANENCVVVLSNGAPIEMPWLDAVPAVLEIYLAGQAGAHALVDLVLGDVSPSGKLAESFPMALADCPAQENFATHKRQLVYREGLNIGYRYFTSHDVPMLFPFGHGLSYTQFGYSDAKLLTDWDAAIETVELAITVSNTGDCAGAEVVQLYVRDVEATAYRPDRELKAFQKLMLQPGEAQTLTFTLDKRAFAYFDVTLDDFNIDPGEFEILFAASSTDIRETLRVTLPDGSGRNSQPPREAPYVIMQDAQLAALGLKVTPPESIKPYHANTTLADIRGHWLGKRVANAALEMAAKTMGKRQETPVAMKMREEMIMSLRLKTVQIMSGGALTPKRFDLLLHALNNRWLRFLARLFKG